MFPSRLVSVLGGGTGLQNNYSLAFDGSNDYVNLGDNFIDGLSAFTVQIWFKCNSFTANRRLMGAEKSGLEQHFRLSGSNVINCLVDIGGTEESVTSTVDISSGWHLATFTYDGSNLKIYNDSIFDTSTSASGAVDTVDADLYVGARNEGGSSPSQFFDGNIDEIAIWNTALSAGDISALYQAKGTSDLNDDGNSANLQGWWRMGDGDTFPTITDNSTNSNDGTMTNMASDDIVKDTP